MGPTKQSKKCTIHYILKDTAKLLNKHRKLKFPENTNAVKLKGWTGG